jgi:hypothetical protein
MLVRRRDSERKDCLSERGRLNKPRLSARRVSLGIAAPVPVGVLKGTLPAGSMAQSAHTQAAAAHAPLKK